MTERPQICLCESRDVLGRDAVLCMEGRSPRDVIILAWSQRPRCGDTFIYDGVVWELVEWIREETGKPVCGWVAQAIPSAAPHHDSGAFRQVPAQL
jgi:hypothetical protein